MFPESIIAAVVAHMNGDHPDDNRLIAAAFAANPESVTGASMCGLDGTAGVWALTRADGSQERLTVPWPGGPITERAEVRREIVALYDAACARLGVTPRPHA